MWHEVTLEEDTYSWNKTLRAQALIDALIDAGVELDNLTIFNSFVCVAIYNSSGDGVSGENYFEVFSINILPETKQFQSANFNPTGDKYTFGALINGSMRSQGNTHNLYGNNDELSFAYATKMYVCYLKDIFDF